MASTVNKGTRSAKVAQKTFLRLFNRHAREVYYFGKPSRVERDLQVGGDLFVDEFDSYVEESTLDYQDSSSCLLGIVTSAEPSSKVRYGEIEQLPAGSFHKGSYYVMFRLDDVIYDPIGHPNHTLFDRESDAELGWGGQRYAIDSYSIEGYGDLDFFVKVLAHKIS